MTAPSSIDLDCVLRIDPHVRFRLFGEEAVVVAQRSAEVLGVNAVGARLLTLLDGHRSLREALGTLIAEFDGEPERMRGDVLGFARELMAAGVVVAAHDEEAR